MRLRWPNLPPLVICLDCRKIARYIIGRYPPGRFSVRVPVGRRYATALDLYTDVGLALDVLILRLSLGAGPNFTYVFGGAADPAMFGFNIKANADLKLGRVTVGLSYLTGLVIDGGLAWDKSTGLLGASVLFWL